MKYGILFNITLFCLPLLTMNNKSVNNNYDDTLCTLQKILFTTNHRYPKDNPMKYFKESEPQLIQKDLEVIENYRKYLETLVQIAKNNRQLPPKKRIIIG